MPVALPPEVRHEDRWHEELHQRSAEEADELSEHPEQGMPELVDREVEAVEPAVVAGVENQEPAVHREHGGEGEARAPLRYEIGRASWRGRVEISVGAVSLKKKNCEPLSAPNE